MLAQQVQRFFLLCGGHGGEWQTASRIAHMRTVVINAGDVFRREEQSVAFLAEGGVEAAAQDLIAFAGLLEFLLHTAADFVCQLDAQRVELSGSAPKSKRFTTGSMSNGP